MGDKAKIIDSVVAAGDKAWSIMKDGAPVSGAESKFLAAVPKGMSPSDPIYNGRYDKASGITFGFVDGFGLDVIRGKLKIMFRHSGKVEGSPGLFVTDFSISDNGTHVRAFGYCEVKATLTGTPTKVGMSGQDPIWSITLKVEAHYGQKYGNRARRSWNVTARGDGKCVIA
ncbi:MAG: hypothetical protein AAFW65_08725 [Pseudomonadota bacterium]